MIYVWREAVHFFVSYLLFHACCLATSHDTQIFSLNTGDDVTTQDSPALFGDPPPSVISFPDHHSSRSPPSSSVRQSASRLCCFFWHASPDPPELPPLSSWWWSCDQSASFFCSPASRRCFAAFCRSLRRACLDLASGSKRRQERGTPQQ